MEEENQKKAGWLIIRNPVVEIESNLKKLNLKELNWKALDLKSGFVNLKKLNSKAVDLKSGFETWVSKPHPLIDCAVHTGISVCQGVVFGVVAGSWVDLCYGSDTHNPFMPKFLGTPFQLEAYSGGPLVQARKWGAVGVVHGGITWALRNFKKEHYLESEMITALGMGAMFSLVSGMGGPNQFMDMLSSGIFLSLAIGGLTMLDVPPKPPKEDPSYMNTRSMLSNLGLQNYEKNFRRCKLNDSTLPFLTDSALDDARIPLGPRFLILNHIERNPELGQKSEDKCEKRA